MIATDVVLRYERTLVLGTLGSVALLCWAYLLLVAGLNTDLGSGTSVAQHAIGAHDDAGLELGGFFPPKGWSAGEVMLVFTMWVAIMTAMMLPAAAPAALQFARLERATRADSRPWVSSILFAAGYLAVWVAFCAAATGLHWWLMQAGMLSDRLTMTGRAPVALLLAAAGAWQLTPVKRACLRLCRNPTRLFEHALRRRSASALGIGATHGLYCLGCFSFLMALLFVGGVTNPLWIIGLALYVMIEKLLPAGPLLMPMAGVVLLGTSALVAVQGI